MSAGLTDAGLTDADPLPARFSWLALVAVTLVGLVVRAVPLALSDFPVNDGGLFLAMTRAIASAGWALPATVAWNGQDLPFLYPPLAFYAVGALTGVLGLDPFDVFRWFPLLWSALVVPAVYLLGRELLRSSLGGLVAALAYALFPVSYVWLVQGGGVTRAPGMFLAVISLWQILRLVREPTRRRGLVVGVLGALTALVHPGAAIFLAVSSVLFWVFEGQTIRSALAAAWAIAVAAVLVAPWALLIVSRHGLAAVLDVPNNGPDPVNALLSVFAARVTGTPITDPLAVIGVALTLLCVIRRRFFLPLWFGASLLLSYQYAMVAFGILVGLGAVDLSGLRAAKRGMARAGETADYTVRWIPIVGFAVLGSALVAEGIASALTVYNPAAPLHALSSDRRAAMDWVASTSDPNVRVVVVTFSEWSGDPDSEWFPLLSERTSVATVQGSELLGATALEHQLQSHRALQACVQEASADCVVEFLGRWPAEYLFLPLGPLNGPSSGPDCCADLRTALTADDRFETVHESAGATVFAVRDASLSAGVPR